MSEYTTSRTTRYLPQVAIATTLVTIGPVVIVWLLLDEGVISSPWVCVGLAIALSLGASFLGSAYWQRRGGHGDVFFSELLLWGWLRRLQGERRLNSAVGLLGLANPDQRLAEGEATVERKAQLLRQMAAALDAQDPYTDGHSRRVALHSAMVARRMHVPSEEAAQIRTAAAIHDIGKLRIPPEVLNKPEALTLEEFAIVRRHADEGAEIVSSMEDPEITAMVRHHHERFDGGGYPSGLIGEQTPLGARIIAVADTFDALTSVRPYRSAIPHKRALDAIAAASGTQLDPVVVRTFLKCYSANRATVFWTLLAISPSRAVAWLRGRGAGQGNLASAGTVAAPAVIAAVFGMTLGSSATIFSRDPLAAAKKPSAAGSNGEKQRSSRAGPKHSATPKPTTVALAALPLRQSVLATNTVRSGRWASSHATRRAGSGAGSGPGGSNGGSRGSQGRSGANPGKPVKTAPPPQSGSPARPPTHHPHPVPTSGSPGAGGAMNPPPSSAGNPGTQGGPGGSGGSNGGGGSGGSGGGTPLTKDDCKGGGYTQYNFPNQGQCVAFVERGSH